MGKSILLICFVLTSVAFTSGLATKGSAFQKGAGISFDVLVHDFGTLKEGDVVNCVFKFTNTGNEPLIVEDVEQPCGCTIPSWSKEPIMPGKTGEIKVIFNSKERAGVFRRTLAVKSNAVSKTKEQIYLMVKGNVLTKAQWKKLNVMGKK